MSTGSAFEDAFSRFDRLIAFVAMKYAGRLPGIEIQDLIQEGRIKLYTIYTSLDYADKPVEELDAIFKRALNNRLLDLVLRANKERATRVHLDLDTIDSFHLAVDGFSEIRHEHLRDHLKAQVSADAGKLLVALLDPPPSAVRSFQIRTMRRNKVRSQGRNTFVGRKIPHELIGCAVGFSSSQTKRLVRELQHAYYRSVSTLRRADVS